MTKKILAITIIISLLVFSGCGNKQAVNQDLGKNVKPITIGLGNISTDDEFAGEIQSNEQVGVVPKAPGKVSSVKVDIGDRVSKGQILFTLDSTDSEYQLKQAQAGLDLATVNYNRAGGSGFSQSLVQAQAAYEQAKLSYDDAKQNYDRMNALYTKSAVAKKDLDSAQNRMLSSKQQLDTASSNLDLLKNGIGPDSVDGAQAQLNQSLASVKLIQSQVDNTRVVAPISGIVAKRNINIGEGVSTGNAAIVIVNTNQLVAQMNIPEKLINKFEIGQKISVIIEALENGMVDGIVSNISPVADSKTHNYIVKVKIIDKDNNIKPGMFAKIKVETSSKNNVVVIPNQAIIPENGVQYVYTVKDNKISKHIVKVGLSNASTTEILEGVGEGEEIITEGQSFLSDGEKVNIIK